MSAALLLLAGLASAAPAPKAETPPAVLAARWDGPVTPVFAEFVKAAIEKAEASKKDAVVLELDTPGGLDSSMRDAVKAILASQVPVIVFVSPAGARAASAGVFVTMAAHLSAMTPGANIGAAHPVQLGGSGDRKEKKDEKAGAVMDEKMANDFAAYFAALAARRGRNGEWAASVVHKSSSVASAEAVRMRIVDLEANDLEDLLAKAHGRTTPDFKAPLRTKGAAIERLALTRRQELLKIIVDPNVAMILMSIGVAGIMIELYNPGLILPGIVGVVALILAFYSFQTLSVSAAGVLLMLAGVLFLILELNVVSFGMLAVAGVSSLLLGLVMIARSAGDFQIAWTAVFSALAGLGLVGAALAWITAKALKSRPRMGEESLIGRELRAETALDPYGTVMIGAELWRAQSLEGTIPAGTAVKVESVRDLLLLVRKA